MQAVLIEGHLCQLGLHSSVPVEFTLGAVHLHIMFAAVP